jgi:glycosyltransferase involved in cell wall biosynthesis
MSASTYGAGKQGYSIIDQAAERIVFETLFSDDSVRSTADRLRAFPAVMRTLYRLAQQSICMHSGLSWNLLLPYEFVSIVFGLLLERRTVFVVDIDYRNSASMSYRNGDWSKKSYLACKYFYDPLRSLQVWIAAKHCSLVLLKGKKLAHDFGDGQPNVKNFLDASHSEKNIIGTAELNLKLADVRNESSPLKLIYFGRLTAYKGIDRCLKAVALAHDAGANLTFDIIGGGEQSEFLHNLVHDLKAEEYVTLHGPRPFNQEFFQTLYPFHLLLAAPLREDTPRSALDAMAAGIPYLAFDTYYYRQLTESNAGQVVPWPDHQAMAQSLIHLAGHREEVAAMMRNAVNYAHLNTQEIWLERRFTWTMESTVGNNALPE